MMRTLLTLFFLDQALEQGLQGRTVTQQRDKSITSKFQLQYMKQDI